MKRSWSRRKFLASATALVSTPAVRTAALADEQLLLRCSLETAIIFTHNMEVGLVHPPVGLNLFVLSSIAAAPIGETIRGFLPFVVILLLVLCIIIFLPVLTLWLPDAVFGGRL